MKLEQVISLLKETQNITKQFNSQIQSLNSQVFAIALNAKIVFKENGRVYKLDSFEEGLKRLGTLSFFKKWGLNFLVEETLIFFENGVFSLTEQQEVFTEAKKLNDEEVFDRICKDYGLDPQILQKIFEELGFMWYGGKNYGFLNGKIKIFDYITNISTVKISGNNHFSLINSKGRAIHEFSI